MKNPWIAAILNFFFMGPGTFYNGRRKAVGIGLTIGAGAMTFVELQLQSQAPGLFPIMFGAVFVINTLLAYDGYTEALRVCFKSGEAEVDRRNENTKSLSK